MNGTALSTNTLPQSVQHLLRIIALTYRRYVKFQSFLKALTDWKAFIGNLP